MAPQSGACTYGAPSSHKLELIDFKEVEIHKES